ncbi:hypothetical protein C8F01DRAFT_1264234 [Mycena amicta]|nr:hypothetical protein C8F01DRAFT_1264234 [Mycena amicta]
MALANIILTGLGDIQTIRFAQLASSAIIIFDHAITLDEEVELIWKSSWSMGKVLFIINRYYTLISVCVNNYALFSPSLSDSVSIHQVLALPSPPDSQSYSCLAFFRWQGWTGLIAFMIAEVILQMRLYALYYLNKKVLALMLSLFVLCSATSAAIMGTVLNGISSTAHPIPDVTFCRPNNVPHYFFAFWLPVLLFESLLCVLALYRGFQTFRASVSLYQSGRHLVAILIRDSVLYFLVMFATYLTNLLVWLIARPSLLEVPVAFSVALSCCLGNRIVLNVREVKSEMDSAAAEEGKPGGGAPAGSGTSDAYADSQLYYADSHHDHTSTNHHHTHSPSVQLRDIEMAQLRSMRVDTQYVQELETQSGVYEHANEYGYGQFVVL